MRPVVRYDASSRLGSQHACMSLRTAKCVDSSQQVHSH
jgi:hypothetical protein